VINIFTFFPTIRPSKEGLLIRASPIILPIRKRKIPFLRFTMNEEIKEMDFEDLLVDEIEMD